MLKSYAEYNADPSRYPAYFDDYENGKFTVKRFKQIEQGDLHITCGDSDDLAVSEYSGSPESDYQGTTRWYQIVNNGADVKGIIAFPYELADSDKKRAYIEKYDGETMICRMVTEDK